jgi:hypothetical protein
MSEMIEVTKHDANNYCLVLRALGMEDEGDPVAEIERLQAEAVKRERRAIEYGDIVHKQVLAMRAAVVAWQREGAEIGMQWIANTLAGPGHLPSEEDAALGAQPLFDKESAEHEAFRAAHPAP